MCNTRLWWLWFVNTEKELLDRRRESSRERASDSDGHQHRTVSHSTSLVSLRRPLVGLGALDTSLLIP